MENIHRLYKDEEEEDAHKCGFEVRCWRFGRTKRVVFDKLSWFATPRVALAFFCVVSFTQGLVINGFLNSSISTFEKRFNLQSSETGLIGISYDIGSCGLLLFVTYIGGRGHKPLWLGWGLVLTGCGSILISLPHFVAPTYDYNVGEGVNFCGNVTIKTCQGTALRSFRGFLIAGQLIHGIGSIPVYSLGLAYLDENVKQRYSSMYHGFYYAFSVVGPGAGYIIGGAFLSIYTNIGEEVPFGDDSQVWVGAWWLGFIIGGCLFITIAIPIILLPYQFPNTEKNRQNREKEMHADEMAVKSKQDDSFGTRLRDVPKCLLVILRNKPLVLISLGGAMDSALLAGLATFGPKYVESFFSKSASEVSTGFGAVVLLGGCLGTMIGAGIVTRFRLTVRKMMTLSFIFAFIATALLLVFLVKCSILDYAGATVPYASETTINGVSATCNSNCGCSLEIYDPVCGSDNVTYYSPCHAGCTDHSLASCGCVAGSGSVTAGACTGSCQTYSVFLTIAFFIVVFVFLNSIPVIQVSMRVVPFNQRSLALGIQWMFLRAIGAIPAALIYGAVLDSTCLIFNEECGEKGSCKVYDNKRMSHYILALSICYMGASCLFFLLARLTYKQTDNEEYDVDINDHKDIKNTVDVAAHDNPVFQSD